jgi:hypothetical protein
MSLLLLLRSEESLSVILKVPVKVNGAGEIKNDQVTSSSRGPLTKICSLEFVSVWGAL